MYLLIQTIMCRLFRWIMVKWRLQVSSWFIHSSYVTGLLNLTIYSQSHVAFKLVPKNEHWALFDPFQWNRPNEPLEFRIYNNNTMLFFRFKGHESFRWIGQKLAVVVFASPLNANIILSVRTRQLWSEYPVM